MIAHVLRAAFERALAGLDLERRVADAMPRVPREACAVAVVAMGKAAPAMARGALAAAGGRVSRALVIAPDGAEAGLDDVEVPQVELLRAAHPDPDARSVAAARRALDVVRSSDFVLALVSGGASSLVCLPRGLSLARYVVLVRALLLSGASVKQVNVVRRHLCAAKGGGLARAARGRVVTLVASDVIGGALRDVGSGPTVADPTTCAEARAVVARFAPGIALPRMHESLKPGDRAARRLRARFVARPDDLADAIAVELRRAFRSGAHVRVLASSTAPVEKLAAEYVARARTMRRGDAVVRSAEPSLRVDASRPGRGGRSTHLGALVAPGLPRGTAFLAGASDGVDGASGTGGAALDAEIAARMPREAVTRAVAAFDTGRLLASAGGALPEAPTGVNLADVHVLMRLA